MDPLTNENSFEYKKAGQENKTWQFQLQFALKFLDLSGLETQAERKIMNQVTMYWNYGWASIL